MIELSEFMEAAELINSDKHEKGTTGKWPMAILISSSAACTHGCSQHSFSSIQDPRSGVMR